MEKIICEACHEVVTTTMVTTGTGFIHRKCDLILNPPKKYETFSKMLFSAEDQVLLRTVLDELVPEDVKNKVLLKYNEKAADNHQLKINSKE